MSTEADVDIFLEHFGVKGMHWGQRKTEATGSTQPAKGKLTDAERKARVKKVAIGVGAIALAAGTAYAGYKLQQSGHLKIPSLSKQTVDKGKEFAFKSVKEPVAPVHIAPMKQQGYKAFKTGGLLDVDHEYGKAGFATSTPGDLFQRYGDGKIAARFKDPDGRTDAAKRPIMHEVIIPKAFAKDVKSLDDVKAKFWPTLKPEYDLWYHAPRRRDASDIIRDKPVNIRAAKAYKDAGLGTESEYFSMLKRVQNAKK